MTRLGAVFWGGLVLASGFATFNVKYAVQGIDDELGRVRRQTVAEQQEIRVFSAEWAYLNQPERLAELNRSFLQLAPMTTKQLQGRVEELALRAPSAGGADTMIAANPAAGSSPAATPAAVSPPAVTQVAAASAVPPLAAAPAHTARASGTPEVEVQTAKAPAGRARDADGSAGGGSALTEALRLLGIEFGRQTTLVPVAKAAPLAAADAVAAHGADTKGDIRGAETQVADAAAGTVRAEDTPSDAAAGLAEALRLLGNDGGGQTPRVRLAKAAPASPASLDALISKIADTR